CAVCEAVGSRRRLTVVARELHPPNAPIARTDGAQAEIGSVAAAVIDEDDFIGQIQVAEGGGEATMKLVECALLVEEWNDDGQLRTQRRFSRGCIRHTRAAREQTPNNRGA